MVLAFGKNCVIESWIATCVILHRVLARSRGKQTPHRGYGWISALVDSNQGSQATSFELESHRVFTEVRVLVVLLDGFEVRNLATLHRRISGARSRTYSKRQHWQCPT
jgi:hypothetical protein